MLLFKYPNVFLRDFSGGPVVKNPPANAGEVGLIPGLGRFPHTSEQQSPFTYLQGPHKATTEAHMPRAHALQQEFSTVQFSSVAQSCPTLCDPMNCSTPGLPVCHQLPGVYSRGAWWAAVYGVAQSRTRLKRLSRSSSTA